MNFEEQTHCVSCVHRLSAKSLGPCGYVKISKTFKLDGSKPNTTCGCTHVSHFTEKVLVAVD